MQLSLEPSPWEICSDRKDLQALVKIKMHSL